MISNIDKAGIDLIAYYECGGKPEDPKWLKAYSDGNLPTIGIGTIQYPNGQRVKMGDRITPQERDEYFIFEIRQKVERVNFLTRDDINQNQFNSIVSFAYNCGTIALQKSSLLTVLNTDPREIGLINKFCAWRFDNGKFLPGLLRRRMSESLHFFTGKLKYDWINYKTFSSATITEVKKAITTQ